MQSRPFQHQRLRATAHFSLDDFQRIDVDLDFFALIRRVKVRRRMVAVNIRMMIP